LLSITGGRFKGLGLRTPAGNATRPTSGKVRQALFNILRGRIEGLDFLDLCAGSGAVGLEALSRGCRRAVLVEKHPAAFRALEGNCRLLLSQGAEAGSLAWLRRGAAEYCAASARQGLRFGTVFADPPFSSDFPWLWPALAALLEPDGMGVVQFPTRNPPDFTANARVYAYGESSLAVFGPF
jgi:16S rRNA (guanine966-N2)-methyltransferase